MSLTMLQEQRELMIRTVEGLSPEALFTIPEGRKNHVAWNLGHLLTVQQQLTYGLSRLPLGIPASYPGLFGKDTSPETWVEPPKMAEVLSLLRATAGQFEKDHAAGSFSGFKPYTMSLTGITLETIDDAAAFNTFHEGLHFGIVLSILRELGER